jgi:excisionase family DNA binding protein
VPSRRLSYQHVAELLDVSVRTVRRLVEQGFLAPPRKYKGAGIRFLEEDVYQYLITQSEPAVPEPRQGQKRSDRMGQGGTNEPRSKDS